MVYIFDGVIAATRKCVFVDEVKRKRKEFFSETVKHSFMSSFYGGLENEIKKRQLTIETILKVSLSLRSCCVNPTQLAMIWVESVYVKGDKQKRRTSSSVREDRRSELSVAVHTIRLNEIGDEFREIKKEK